MYITHGGLGVEFLYITLGVCLSILMYFVYKFVVFQRKQNNCKKLLEQSMMEEIQRAQKEYQKRRLSEMREKRQKTNIFREMAIEEIAKQKLIYDEETGRYVRRRQIN